MKAYGFELQEREMLVLAGLVVGLVIWARSQVAQVVDGAVEFVSDPDNPVNTLAEDVWKSITGSDEGPGADLYDLLHYGTINPNQDQAGGSGGGGW